MIQWKKKALKVMNRLPKDQAERIAKAIRRLHDFGEGDVKPLKGEYEGLYRLRVGNWRVFFEKRGNLIKILSITSRQDAY